MGVVHSTPADDSFSPQGKSAWEAAHSVTGPLAMFGTTTAGTDADTTMVTNTSYDVDMSTWATADRVYTLPTNATVGDEIDVFVQIGNASYELIVKTGAGQTCAFKGSTVAAATEITRLFITGERLRFRYQATNKWECILDGRVPCRCYVTLSAAVTTNTAGTAKAIGFDTETFDIGSVYDHATNKYFTARRAGRWLFSGGVMPNAGISDQNYFGVFLYDDVVASATKNYSEDLRRNSAAAPSVLATAMISAFDTLAVDAKAVPVFLAQEANIGIAKSYGTPHFFSSFFSATEML